MISPQKQKYASHGRQVGRNYSSRGLHAPYNFVPLSRWIYSPDWADQVSHDFPFEDGLCGHLDFTIRALSPILVGQEQNREKPLTFHRLPDGRFAIPGSTLRGLIRNVIEIAAFGKLRYVDNQRFGVRDLTNGAASFYRRYLTHDRGNQTYEPLSKSGWLRFEGGKWSLTPCEHARVEQQDLRDFLGGKSWVSISKSERPGAIEKYEAWITHKSLAIDFQAEPPRDHPHGGKRLYYRKATKLGGGSDHGMLVFTGQPGPSKHMEFIFFPGGTSALSLPDDVANDFLAVHADSSEWKSWHKDKPAWQSAYTHGIPVFYLAEPGGRIRALGLAQMFKLAYRHSVGDMIDHSHPRHRDENTWDLADLIFGTAHSEEPSRSLKGRADFSTAFCTDSSPQELRPSAVILSNPKPTFYPNYVVQDADRGRLKGREYRTYDGPGVEIRGWKRYPARPVDPLTIFPPLEGKQKENRKVQVRLQPLAEGVVFTGKVRFHNLLPVELGALCWALTWANNPQLRHSVGLGKPLGLGQICIVIDKSDIRVNQFHKANVEPPFWKDCMNRFVDHMDTKYRQAQVNDTPIAWMKSEQLVQLLAMADPDKAPGVPGNLNHPLLDIGHNEFLVAKKSLQVLPEYAAFSGRRDRNIDWSAPENKITSAEYWLKERLQTLSAQHHAPEDTLIFGRLLAQEWQQISESKLKDEVLAIIQKCWKEAGSWDNPRGKSAKQARTIYKDDDN